MREVRKPIKTEKNIEKEREEHFVVLVAGEWSQGQPSAEIWSDSTLHT